MDENLLHQKLERVFRTVFDQQDLAIADAMTAADVEGWDSLAQINLIVGAEGAFGVRFQTSEIKTLKDIGHFKRLIADKLASGR
jgi:acyl carrier protein